MSKNLNYNINFSTNGAAVFVGLNQHIDQITASTQNMTYNFGESWKKLLSVNQALEGVRNLQSLLDGAIQPGIALNTSLTDLAAITGLTGKALDEISEAARASAIAFGTDAAQNVESYKLLLSQLSPDIAKSSDALKLMGDHVNTLSKTMGGNTVAATEVLTTAMNQYGVSLDDPMQASKTMADMMNVMAAAAKEGCAELPQIKAALQQVGMVAKTTGVTFSETNAAIQVLDKAGKKGAEGGVALRNVLSTLNKGRFLPKETRAELEAAGISIARLTDKSIPLTDRLKALKPIVKDTALVTKLFDEANAASAIALIEGTEAIDDYNKKIQGTNTAVDQARIVMKSHAEQLKSSKAWYDDIKISIYNFTQSWLPGTQNLLTFSAAVLQSLSGLNGLASFLMPITNGIWNLGKKILIKTGIITADTAATILNATATSGASRATKIWTGIQRIFNTVIASNPLGITVKAVVLLTAGIIAATAAVSAYNKNQDTAKTVANELNSQILIEKRGLNDLFEQLKRTNPESQRRKELIDEMNARYPGLLDYQKLEKANEKEIEKARRDANDELERTIILSATKTQKEAFYKKTGEQEKALVDHLFENGATEEQATAALSVVKREAEAIIKSGQYKAGMFSGTSNPLLVQVMDKISDDPALKGVNGKRSSEMIELLDTMLSGLNEMAAHQRYEELKLGKTPPKKEDAPVPDPNKEGKSDDKNPVKGAKGKKDKGKGTTGKNTLENLGANVANDVKNHQSTTSTLSGFSNSNNSNGGNRSLTINKLVETLIVKVERLPESKERIKDAVSEALLTAVNDYNLAT